MPIRIIISYKLKVIIPYLIVGLIWTIIKINYIVECRFI